MTHQGDRKNVARPENIAIALFVLQKKDYVMAIEYIQKAVKLGK